MDRRPRIDRGEKASKWNMSTGPWENCNANAFPRDGCAGMNIDGLEINSYDKGEGDAILFLHGWGTEFAPFVPFLDDLTVKYRTLALDLPGFGKSAPPPRSWGVDEYADFVAEYLRASGVNEIILIGHSFGGRIAIKLAARYEFPVKIPKMVLTGAAGILPVKTLAAKIRQIAYKTVRAVLSTQRMRKSYPHLIERWRRANASEDYINATPLMRDVLVKVVNEDLAPCLPLIECPTLLIWGENDTATPLEDGRLMERMITGAGLAVLPSAGHYAFLDQPYAFGRILDSFLDIER